jgi:hypothetical protein
MDKLPHYCPICAFHEWNLDGLVEMIWEYLDLVRGAGAAWGWGWGWGCCLPAVMLPGAVPGACEDQPCSTALAAPWCAMPGGGSPVPTAHRGCTAARPSRRRLARPVAP